MSNYTFGKQPFNQIPGWKPHYGYQAGSYLQYLGTNYEVLQDFVSTNSFEHSRNFLKIVNLTGTGQGGDSDSSTLKDNGDGTYTFKDSSGATLTFNTITPASVSANNNNDLTLGTDNKPFLDVSEKETLTSLSFANKELTYKDEKETVNKLDLSTLEATPATEVSPASDDDKGAVGTSDKLAREDHKHPVQGPSSDAENNIETGSDNKHYFTLSASKIGVPTTGKYVLGYSNGVLTVFPL